MITINLDNPLVQSYIFYSAILAIKLIVMSALTSVTRISRNVFANPEDAVPTKGKVKFDDPVVERIRRAHLNDLESIPAFWLLGALYVTIGPTIASTQYLFRVYTLCRILHTFVYAIRPLPQPTRAIAFYVPFLISAHMGVRVVFHYIAAW